MMMRQFFKYSLLVCVFVGMLSHVQAQDIGVADAKHKPCKHLLSLSHDNQHVVNSIADSLALNTFSIADSLRLNVDSLRQLDSTTIRMALLLPLHADAVKREKNMERFYDFYAGSLIAIYEQQAKGQRLEVFTYDIGKTTPRMNEVLQQYPIIHQLDVIIGPAYSQQVDIVLDSLCHDSVWVMIPFLSRVKNLTNNPFVMKFNPSEQIEADTIARYLAQRKDSVNCVLLETKPGEVIPSGIAALHQAIEQYQVPTSMISLKAILSDSIEGVFMPDKENIVIFNTERYANLQTVMPHLLKACGEYRITLFSHYSWQTEKIILPQLYTSVFTTDPVVPAGYEQLFEQYFDHTLSSYQPRYDLLGYDLTNYVITMIGKLKKNKATTITSEVWTGIQADIFFQPATRMSGYENNVVHIIHQ